MSRCVNDSWDLRSKVADHLAAIVKNRSIVLTGDMGHLSIGQLINDTFANIDAPRKYEFQALSVHEDDALRGLLWALPEYQLPHNISEDDVAQAIAGTRWLETNDFSYSSNKCYDCGQIMGLKFKGVCVELYCKKECEHNRQFSVEIDFPTGVVVFADWPDHFEDLEESGLLASDHGSVNYLKGQRQATENFALNHILHHSVGNTCPRWYYNAATQCLQIGSDGYDEETDESRVPEGFEEQGYFCTDLWWATMVDEQHYKAMLAQSGVTQIEESKNERATIAPGRYRFTCYGRIGDNHVHARAQRIGDCEEAPSFDVEQARTVLPVVEAAGHSRAQYDLLYRGEDAAVMFKFLDQNLNVIGNGVSNYGEFLSHHSVAKGKSAQGTALVWNGNTAFEASSVYPNFKKNYSLVWQMPIKHFPSDWLEAAVWFYETCRTYFENGACGYMSAYPSPYNRDEDLIANMEKQRTEGMSDVDFFAAVSAKWGAAFDGDVVAFQTARWNTERERIIAFIDETIECIQKELNTRV